MCSFNLLIWKEPFFLICTAYSKSIYTSRSHTSGYLERSRLLWFD